MLSIYNTKTTLIFGLLFGIFLFSLLNLLSYVETKPKLPFATKEGVFKPVKIGKTIDFFFLAGGVTGKCYLGICKKWASRLTESDVVIVELDVDGKIYSAKNKIRNEVLFSYSEAVNEVSSYLRNLIIGFFVIFLISIFLIFNRNKNVKY